MKVCRVSRAFLYALCIMMASATVVYANAFLDNGIVRAEFDSRGLVSIRDIGLNRTFTFQNDNCSVTVGGVAINTSSLTPAVDTSVNNAVSFLFTSGNYRLKVIYEIRAGWRFVSRQIELTPTVPGSFRVNSVTAMSAKVVESISQTYRAAGQTGTVFLRFPSSGPSDPGTGLMLIQQNNFLTWSISSGSFTMRYTPDMDWKDTYGPFLGDRVCIGTYQMIGSKYPASRRAEWVWSASDLPADGMDWSEIEAAQNCVRAFLLFDSSKAVRIDVGWCSNDYQIDTSTAAGKAEYKRLIDMCNELGINNILYTPANDLVAPLYKNTDAWAWENVLWLNMGQKIRTGEFIAATSPLPASVQEMVDYARSRNVGCVSYVYPSLGFKQDPEWTAWCGGNTGGYNGADTGVRSFQDWLVQQMVDFHNNTGTTGYSFDHWWIAYNSISGNPPVSSKYAQWYGCRRILENLRQGVPDVIIDGRQQYQNFGPWTWLAGSYPHPTATDEQPASFKAFPDLHTDRVSANRHRYTAYWFRMDQMAPPEITPGFITHQTQRSDSLGITPKTAFRTRDWDLLGWKFSLFSTIGTAPFNLVMNMIPARDIDEYNALSEADKQFFRTWFDWVDSHIEYMRVLRPIIGYPAIGRVDGTAAIIDDNGFIFLFNPNYRKMNAQFRLDTSIGLKSGQTFIIKEIEPATGRLIGKPQAGVWSYGDTVSIAMDGTTAMVLELQPAANPLPLTLFNVTGNAAMNGGALQISGASGEMGTVQEVCVRVPSGTAVSSFTANGVSFPFTRVGDAISASVRFDGVPFNRCQQVGTFSPTFTGTKVTGSFTIPERIFAQLASRRITWPVPYTEEDLLATWLGSDRLLLFIHIASPTPSMVVSAKIDGFAVPVKKAYNGIYSNSGDQTFMGFYIDASRLVRDIEHTIEVTIPSLAAGQFQGLYFDNVEAEYTQVTTNSISTPLTYTVSGKVTDTEGVGIAGATVYFSDAPNASDEFLITATTDASGNYSRPLPNSTNWYVAAGASAYNSSADKTATVNGSNVSGINFTLTSNTWISGRVTRRSDGTPISGATVYFSRTPNSSANPVFTTTTNASGYYSQAVQNTTWYVSATADGCFGSADKVAIMNGVNLPGIDLTLAANTRNIPRTSDLLFSCVTDTLPMSGSTGNWATYLPAGQTLTAMGSPTAEMISGIKWEKNDRIENDGYLQGTYSSAIAVNGASIVVALKPKRIPGYGDPWTSAVDIMYDRLVLGIHNGTGKVCVRRNGSLESSALAIPDGQITILSLVVQPDGKYKVYANGTQIMNITATNALTSLVPNVTGGYANRINVGRNNPDSWPTFNGNIGDVFVYKVALTDAERQQLEADLLNKFVSCFVTASAGVGGSISPDGATQVSYGGSQSFTITPSAGYAIANVSVDGVPQGPVSSFTFVNVTADRTISASFVQIAESVASIAALKAKAANTLVNLTGDETVIYAPRNASNERTTNFFYVGEKQGMGGLKVVDMTFDTLVLGNKVTNLVGYVRKPEGGEVYLELIADVTGAGNVPILPVGMSSRSALNDPKALTNAVKVWGKVKSVNGTTSFTINDNCGDGITVILNGVALPVGFDTTRTAVVTGVLSADKAVQAQAVSAF